MRPVAGDDVAVVVLIPGLDAETSGGNVLWSDVLGTQGFYNGLALARVLCLRFAGCLGKGADAKDDNYTVGLHADGAGAADDDGAGLSRFGQGWERRYDSRAGSHPIPHQQTDDDDKQNGVDKLLRFHSYHLLNKLKIPHRQMFFNKVFSDFSSMASGLGP